MCTRGRVFDTSHRKRQRTFLDLQLALGPTAESASSSRDGLPGIGLSLSPDTPNFSRGKSRDGGWTAQEGQLLKEVYGRAPPRLLTPPNHLQRSTTSTLVVKRTWFRLPVKCRQHDLPQQRPSYSFRTVRPIMHYLQHASGRVTLFLWLV